MKVLKWSLAIFLGLFALSLISLAMATTPILKSALHELARRLQKEHGVQVTLGDISTSGLLTVQIAPVSLVGPNQEIVFSAKGVRATLSPLAYFFDSIPIGTIEIDEPDVYAQINSSSEEFNPDISFGLRDVRVHKGRIRIGFGDKDVVIHDLEAALKRVGRKYRVDLSLGETRISAGRHSLDIWDVYTQYYVGAKELLGPKQIDIRRFQVRAREFQLGASGLLKLDDPKSLGLKSDLQIQFLGHLDQVARHFALPIFLAGDVGLDGRMTYARKQVGWQYEGRLRAEKIEVDDMQFESLDAELLVNRFGANMGSGEAKIGATTARLALNAKFDEHIRFGLSVNADNLSLYDLLYDLGIRRAWTELSIDIGGHVEGQVFPKFTLQGQAKGQAYDLLVSDGPVRDLRSEHVLRTAHVVAFDMGVQVDGEAFRFKGAQLDDGVSRGFVDCSLFFDKRRGMTLDGKFGVFDFDSLAGEIADNAYSGSGIVSGTIFGAYEDLTILAMGKVKDFSFERFYIGDIEGESLYHDDQLAFREIKGDLKGSKFLGSLALNFEGLTRMSLSGSTQKVDVANVRASIPQNPPFELLDEVRDLPWQGPLQANIQIEGPIKKGHRHEITGNIDVALLPGNILYAQPLSEGRVKIRLDKEHAHLNELTMKGGLGQLHVKGSLQKANQNIQAQAKLEQFRLDKLNHPALKPGLLKGVVDFSGDLSGTLKSPQAKGIIKAAGVEIQALNLGDIDTELTLNQQKLALRGSAFSSKGYVDVGLGLRGDMPFSGSIRLQYTGLRSILTNIELPLAMDVFAGAALRFEGSAKQWEKAKGDITLFPASVAYAGLKWNSVGDIRVKFDEGIFNVERLVLQTSHGDSIRATGQASKGKVNLNVKADGDLWILPYFDERVETAYGDFFVDVAMSGDINNPNFFGRGQVDRGYLSLRDYPSAIDNIVIRANFDRHALRLPVLRGSAKKGSFDGQGEVTLKEYLPSHYNLGFRFNDLPVSISSWLTGTSSGQLKLFGPKDDLMLSGDVRLLDALITREIDFDKLAYDFSASSRAIDARNTKGKPLQLNIHVVADKGIVIENSALNAELAMNLNIIGTKDAIGARGTLATLGGDAFFRGHHYRLLKVRVDFDDPYRIWPRFDLEAESRIEDYDVLVRLSGTLDRPKFQLSSRPSLPEQDVLALMTLGVTNRDLKDAMGTARYAGLEALSAYSGIGSKLVSMLPGAMHGTRTLNVDELRFTSVFSQRGGVSLPAVVVGVDVWRGMRLRLQSTLVENPSGTREQRLELEQSLNKDTRWRLVWNSEGASNYGDAGIDLWYRWEF